MSTPQAENKKRVIKYIVIHCTATKQDATIEAIISYWQVNLKWKNPGYHFIITKSGYVARLQDVEKIANGVAGYNEHAIHISYIGGIDKNKKPIDNRTNPQRAEMLRLIKKFQLLYPNAEVLGHRDFPAVTKDCPSFDVKKWLKMYE
jgi:N-acetylmuramoyl-L-alanine amidase